MGCDIHAAMEYKNGDGKWHCLRIPNRYYGKFDWEKQKTTAALDIDRNYDVFAILGNVRNGRGFARIKTGEGFNFISDNRGIPEDITNVAKSVLSNEHSATWVSLRELLEFDWNQRTVLTGIVSAIEFEKWDRCKDFNPWPDSWCGGISGPQITHISNDAMREFLNQFRRDEGKGYVDVDKVREATAWGKPNPHTQIQWEASYMDCAKGFWVKTMPWALKLGKKYGIDNVRIVMDFDS